MSMGLVFNQILIIFGYVAVGFLAGKCRIIHEEQRKFLTNLCSKLLLPCTILAAARLDMGPEAFKNLGLSFAVMMGVMGATLLACQLTARLLHMEAKLNAALTGLVTFPNCTFLGLPLCLALFGDIAVLYNSAAIVAFNILFFIFLLPLFTGGKFSPKSLLTAPTISTVVLLAMLVLGLHWPGPVQTVIGNIGSMISPMTLIIIGVMLSENPLWEILREKRVYPVSLIRNFLIPLVVIAVLSFMPLQRDVKMCVLVYLACPCATLTTIYAVQTDSYPELCARSVIFSTLLFGISLPAVIAVGQMIL